MLIQSDARQIPLQDKSIHCCVTSPPYWGLRDYGVAGQLGLERTPEEYIAAMLEVFHEVKRVLRDDGTLWLNMGDSYAGSGNGWQKGESSIPRAWLTDSLRGRPEHYISSRQPNGLKPKDLVGIPWMLAFALRADGWYLRSDIIWSKPNPMPESVTDRPTKAHEYIFLLSKSERYYYDADAIAEEALYGELRDGFRGENDGPTHYANQPSTPVNHEKFSPPRSWRGSSFTDERDLLIRPNTGKKPRTSVKRGGFNGKTNEMEGREAFRAIVERRNKRTVWEVATQPTPDAHFATFPEELIKPCILAGCPAGGTVLDPFVGSGTTVLVARELQCKGIGLELNPAYLKIAAKRLSQEVLDFAGEMK